MGIVMHIVGQTLNVVSLIAPKAASKRAFSLFTKPLKGLYNDKQRAYFDSAFKEELSYNNLSIMTYRWLGSNGKTVLLAHGWDSNSHRWAYLIDLLKSLDYTVLAIDAPAHGRSGSEECNAILYSEFINVVAQKHQPDIVIGHSVGGMATLFFQHKYQLASIDKLVILGAPSNFVGVFDRYVKMLGYNNIIKKGLDTIIFERFGQLPDYFNTARLSEEISTKALIIHDTEDKIIPYNDALDYKKHYKNAQLVTTTGYGHSLRSEEVTQHILKFLND